MVDYGNMGMGMGMGMNKNTGYMSYNQQMMPFPPQMMKPGNQ